MKMFARAIVIVSLVCTTVVAQQSLPKDAFDAFKQERYERHLNFLASDAMRGRNTPSPELERAADYIAEHFKKIGLEPIGASYKLPYTLYRPDIDTSSAVTYLRINRNGTTQEFRLGKDFIPFDATGDQSVKDLPVAYVGFGITAPEYDYDDYAGIDVTDRVVIAFRGEPEGGDTTKFRGAAFTRYSSVQEKVRNALMHGASAILLVDAIRAPRKPLVTGYSWPALFPNARSGRGLTLPDGPNSIVVQHIGEAVVDATLGSLDVLREYVRQIDATYRTNSKQLDGLTITTAVKLAPEPIIVHNVAGILRGTEKPDEYAVMGAHYDHVGVGRANADGDSIYNGADDNASGTTSLMVAAEALAGSKTRPARSIVFVAFSGEEKGLLGSKAYAANSPLPMNKCVAMINTDMIGRCEENKVSIGGNERCPDLVKINEEENAKTSAPFSLAYDIEQYFFRSDQASFAMKRIPVLFYFTGEHKDYHKVTDEIAKINFRDLLGISRLATTVLWRAAHLPRTTYVPAGFEE
jgi:hypothetical protein